MEDRRKARLTALFWCFIGFCLGIATMVVAGNHDRKELDGQIVQIQRRLDNLQEQIGGLKDTATLHNTASAAEPPGGGRPDVDSTR